MIRAGLLLLNELAKAIWQLIFKNYVLKRRREILKQNQIFKNRIVSSGRFDVRLGAESVGVESSGRLVESGGGSPAELRTGAKHQGDERNEFDDGRHWRLSEKTFAGFFTRRPSAANSALLYDVRTFRRRSRDRLRRSASRYAIIQPRLCPHSACCRSDIYRKLSSHWVSKKKLPSHRHSFHLNPTRRSSVVFFFSNKALYLN